jgi:hypothetical protein
VAATRDPEDATAALLARSARLIQISRDVQTRANYVTERLRAILAKTPPNVLSITAD